MVVVEEDARLRELAREPMRCASGGGGIHRTSSSSSDDINLGLPTVPLYCPWILNCGCSKKIVSIFRYCNQFLETLTVRMVEMFKVCRNVMPCEVKKDTHLYTCGKIH